MESEEQKFKNPNMGLRWTVLLVILLNVAYSYFGPYLINGRTTQEVSNQYYSLFTPAPFTFSIWGLIYFSFIVYGIAQLMRSQQSKWIYDHLAGPMIFIQVMGIIWITAFSYEYMTTSLGVIVLMLIGGIVAFGRAKRSMINPVYSRLITFPFSLFLGWISIAVIANTAVYILSLGGRFNQADMVNYTELMLGVAFVLAMTVSLVFRDWVYPAVIAWGMYGISVADQGINFSIVQMAFYGAVALGLWSLAYAIYRSARLRQYMHDYRHLHRHQISH